MFANVFIDSLRREMPSRGGRCQYPDFSSLAKPKALTSVTFDIGDRIRAQWHGDMAVAELEELRRNLMVAVEMRRQHTTSSIIAGQVQEKALR